MSWLENSVNFVLKKLVSLEVPPNKVVEVKAQEFSSRFVRKREESLVLYGPTETRNTDTKYEIVLNVPFRDEAYSLYRSENLREAEERFETFKNTIPACTEIAPELCNTSDMQRVCDTMAEHKGWSVGHLVAHMSLVESVQNPLVLSCLNFVEPTSGRLPLHVALETGNKKLIQAFVTHGSSLIAKDWEGNTCYHYAATTSREIIQYLQATLKDQPELLDETNKDGLTPLHLACLEDKPPCVEALLLAGANANIPSKSAGPKEPPPVKQFQRGLVAEYLQRNPNKLIYQDMKFGGTPLHWASSREVIETLADMGCDVNATNFSQRTPLHVMASKGKLDCVVALLSCGAIVELRDLQGDTPLHLAARERSISVIQALLIYEAPLDILNNKGFSPRHEIASSEDDYVPQRLWAVHAVGAKRCQPDTFGCKDGCIAGGTFDGLPPKDPTVVLPSQQGREILEKLVNEGALAAKEDGVRLLALDGGGIRGLVLVQVLLAIEKALNGVPLTHVFDWIAGTSTGGILALGLSTGKTILECQSVYLRLKEQVFCGKRPYNSEPLEKMLQTALGEHTVMTEIKHPKITITGLLADRKPPEMHMFRNYDSAIDVLTGTHHLPNRLPSNPKEYHTPPSPKSQKLWEAGRATGAAPSYFRAYGPFVDGGLIANNPTMDAMTEIHELNLALKAVGRGDEAKPLYVVVSVGTGEIPLSQMADFDVFRPESLFDTMKVARGLSTLGTLLVDQATLATGRVIDRTRSWCSSMGVPFFRFSPQMSEEIEMDERDDAKLVNMLWEAKAFMHKQTVPLQKLAELLLKNRNGNVK
ncbi:85/88 kDa calcium-independent phospholipase A2 [Neocloeon triangulifer]|uniref:85/88 kDa calcium-independent phospholipase A2 n=1 Tax=Neocloeon triangulifer TaxID=2078957 RepID=UPI00286F9C46|nr:85/88 kDa calcium-independent phospholipase A2 [Neocloeon triangulifer]